MRASHFCILLVLAAAACDLRSGIAKQEMEKYTSTPPSPVSPTPTPPIDPADAVEADLMLDGKLISVNGYDQQATAKCDEFNQLMVNGDRNVVTISGVCRQIMINGDSNQIGSDAAVEFVFNGRDNTVWHSRFANSKHPSVIDNKKHGNVVIKGPRTDGSPNPKNTK